MEESSDEIPKFFYLASCHGNTPGNVSGGEPSSRSSAAHLHRNGITQVVGYYGPVMDKLSTRAEETLYKEIAEGKSTVFGYDIYETNCDTKTLPMVVRKIWRSVCSLFKRGLRYLKRMAQLLRKPPPLLMKAKSDRW